MPSVPRAVSQHERFTRLELGRAGVDGGVAQLLEAALVRGGKVVAAAELVDHLDHVGIGANSDEPVAHVVIDLEQNVEEFERVALDGRDLVPRLAVSPTSRGGGGIRRCGRLM